MKATAVQTAVKGGKKCSYDVYVHLMRFAVSENKLDKLQLTESHRKWRQSISVIGLSLY